MGATREIPHNVMITPRSLKAAIENGYVVCKLYAKGASKIRVTLKERTHENDRKMFLEFWIDREYFKRNYPSIYERF